MCVPPLRLIVMCTGCIHRLRFLLRTTVAPSSSTLHTTPSSSRTMAVSTPIYWTRKLAVIVCCTMQVNYGLVGVVGIGRKFSKPLVCISTLLHHVACHTATHIHMAGMHNGGKYISRYVCLRLCLCSTHWSPTHAILPNSRISPPSKLVSNFILLLQAQGPG